MSDPSPGSPGAARRSRATALLALALAASVVGTFAGARHGAFLPYDDDVYVTQHPLVAHGFSAAGVRAAFLEGHAANWHPLTWLSHMLDVELFGLAPAGHHWVSVLLHAASTALLFLFLRWTTGRLAASALCAALFGLHPLRVESVAWIAERKDVLAGACFALTLLAYAAYARRPSAARFLAALCAFALGLLAKPTLVSLPFLLLLLDRWPLGRLGAQGEGFAPARPLRALLLEKLPFLALAAACAWIAYRVQSAEDTVSSLDALPLAARVANAFRSYAAYVADTVWPAGLAAFYPHPALLDPDRAPFDAGAWAGLALAVLGCALALGAWRRAPWISVGVLAFLGMLVPVLGLVQIGTQARADRYTYLPSIGLGMALVFGLERAVRGRAARLGLCVLGAAVSLALALVSARQVRVWRDGVTLFRHAVAVVPRNYVAESHLGVALALAGDPGEAERALERALLIQPRCAEAWSNLGQLSYDQGRPERAVPHLRRALELDPALAQAASNLGAALAALGREDEALAAFRRAVELAPRDPAVWQNLGVELLRLDQRDEARSALRRARELAPFDPEIARALAAAERNGPP